MKRSIIRLAFVVALAWPVSPALQAEELAEGTWSGTWVNPSQPVPRPRPVSIEIKKTPDPHWRWRPGGGELMNFTFATQGPNGRFALNDVRLDGRSLSYWFQQGDAKVSCRLEFQAEGAYEGDCIAEAGGLNRRITLIPPGEAPPTEQKEATSER